MTFAGVASFVFGSYLLFNTPEMTVPWGTIIGLGAATGAFFAFVIAKALLAQRLRPRTGIEAMVGEIAVVRRTLEPDGMVFVEGELWRARSESGALAVGERVVVTGHDGMLLHVRRSRNRRGRVHERRFGRGARHLPRAGSIGSTLVGIGLHCPRRRSMPSPASLPSLCLSSDGLSGHGLLYALHPFHIVLAVELIYVIALVHFLDREAGRALEGMKPLLTCDRATQPTLPLTASGTSHAGRRGRCSSG